MVVARDWEEEERGKYQSKGTGFSLGAVSRGYSLVLVLGFLIEVASLIGEHGSKACGLSSCSF